MSIENTANTILNQLDDLETDAYAIEDALTKLKLAASDEKLAGTAKAENLANMLDYAEEAAHRLVSAIRDAAVEAAGFIDDDSGEEDR